MYIYMFMRDREKESQVVETAGVAATDHSKHRD